MLRIRAPLALGLILGPLTCDDGSSDDDKGSDGFFDGLTESTGDDGGTDSSTEDDTGGGETTDPGSEDAPVVLAADAWCYLHSTGDEAWLWVVEATAEDPQGSSTLKAFATDGVKVLAGGAEVGTYALACDGSAFYTASWKQDQDGISCANASAYTIVITNTDEDGNQSKPYELTGRRGTDAGGR